MEAAPVPSGVSENPPDAPVRLDLSERPLDDELLAKKQSNMLERLAAKETQRVEGASKKRGDIAEVAAPSESVQRFLGSFSSQREAVEGQLDALGKQEVGAVSQEDLDRVAADIQDLEKAVSHAVYFLPSYEVRASQGMVTQLRNQLEVLRSKVVPKRKFSFGSKKKEKESSGNRTRQQQENQDTEGEPPGEAESTGQGVTVQEGPGIRGQKGETFVQRVCEGEFVLSHLEDCSVYLLGMLRALYIDDVRNCRIFSGPVTGAVHIERVSESVLVLASHQIRIHHTSHTDFYLRVRSRPIVEHTSAVRFAPYVFRYDGLEAHLEKAGLLKDSGDWANVDDFRWLRAIQSPNWSILPESARLLEQVPPE